MARAILTQADVRRLFEYDAERGLLIWRERPASDFEGMEYSATRIAKAFNKRLAGKIAGCFIALGYRSIKIDGESYMAHRLIWLYVHGEWPKEIDHQFGVEAGDRIENLRDTSHSENTRNTKLRTDNTSGAMGIISVGQKWRAQIRVAGRFIHLGTFTEKSDAIAVRKDAERKYGFHENHGRRA